MSWKVLENEAPELAQRGRALLEAAGFLLLGTVRRDGSPRISPVECLFVDGELYVGMMPHSLKVRDLERDARCSLHSVVPERTARDGEWKAHGLARPVEESGERRAYLAALQDATGWAPPEGSFVLVRIELHSAGSFVTGAADHRLLARWRRGGGAVHFRQYLDRTERVEGDA